jgi:signal transduction histidine kinase
MSEDPRAVGFPPGHPPMKSLLGVPIQIGNQLFGMLYLTDREDGQPFDEQDQWLIEAMAGYAALAIAGTKLSEQKRRLALLEERERISMELHDSVIQSLYAIGMHLDLIRSADQLEPSDMDTAIDGLNTVIEDIRSYIMNLKTSHYHQQTIRGCLEQLVERLHVPNDIQIEVDAPDVMPPFTLGTFDSICQMANEAVSNAVRHSGADRIEVNAWQDNSHFCVTIRDNGRGFDLSEVKSRGGLGLMNMQNRARIHGGHIHIETGPGKGTCLKIDMPARNR